MEYTENENIEKVMSDRKKLVDFIFSVCAVIFFLVLTSHLLCSSIKMSVYKDFRQIFKYYDYTNADNYKMITPRGCKIDFFDPKHFLQVEDFYVDDFGNIYKVNYSQSLFFKTKTEQTLVKPKDENGTLIRISDGNRPICSCDVPCSHKDLMTACRNPDVSEIKGRTAVDYCYDYVSKNDAIMIRPDRFERFCVDDFGKAYRVKYTLHGRDITELKSERKGGIIVSVRAGASEAGMIFPLSASENADMS